jgi:hypothetical protein
MSQPAWFRHEPERTATGYRWLDALTDPYWRLSMWVTQRKCWKLMRIGDESWRQARDRTRRYFAQHPELLEDK